MKITVNIDPTLNDTEITVNCAALSPETESIIAALRMMDSQITVIKDDESFILDISKIAYIESVDRRTFVYTEKDCYESGRRLYEFEEVLGSRSFLRISKSTILNIMKVSSIKPALNGRFLCKLTNQIASS